MSGSPHPDAEVLLSRYAALLRTWAPRFDLVSPGDLERLEERHIADSLKVLPWIHAAPEGPCVDVGSGAGFPGIPLAIADPGRQWRLIEPRRKRAAFLEEVVRELDLRCEVLTLRGEEAAADPRLARAHAVAVARALTDPADTLAVLAPLVRPGGSAIAFVGARARVPAPAVVRDGLAIVRIGTPALGEDDDLEDS